MSPAARRSAYRRLYRLQRARRPWALSLAAAECLARASGAPHRRAGAPPALPRHRRSVQAWL